MAERLNYQCKFEKYKEELIRLRRHFHRHPELGLQEFETSAFIQEYLGKLGYRFRIVEMPPQSDQLFFVFFKFTLVI